MVEPELLELYRSLGEVERDVADTLLIRLAQGQMAYGALADEDPRDWLEQLDQELADACHYITFEMRRVRLMKTLKAKHLPPTIRDTDPAPSSA